jgi:dipeptidyl aminopeptidase/acylaminoacyl peptidase
MWIATRKRRITLALCCLSLFVGGRAVAQSAPTKALTREDYARAEHLDRGQLLRSLRNGLVIPHWVGATDRFWYRHDNPTGFDFVLVNAATGRKQPAFDQVALARALGTALKRSVSGDSLPIDDFSVAAGGQTIQVTVAAMNWACDIVTGTCRDVTPPRMPEGITLSPDGRFGVLTHQGNLWVREIATGQERALTTDGEGANYGYGIYSGGWKAASIPRERLMAAGHVLPPMETSWSPDSRVVIVPRVDQRQVADYPMLETVPSDGSFRPKLHLVRVPLLGERPPSIEWFAIDVVTGAAHRLEFPYSKLLVPQQDLLAIRKVWWDRGNRHLYAVAFGDNMESAFFFDADVTTGLVRTVIEEHQLPRTDLNSTSYNPPNVQVTSDGRDVIWFSQRDGWGHLYHYDCHTAQLLNQITSGNWLVRDIIQIDEVRRRIYFTGGGREGGNPYYRYLYRVNFDGSGLTLLTPEPADHMLTSPYNDVLAIDGAQGYQVVSPTGSYVVYNYSTPSRPTETVIRATTDGHLVGTVERADASALYAAGYRPPEEFVVKAADATTDLWGALYKPAAFDSTRRYPVLDVEYASPLTAVVPRNFVQALTGPSSPSAPSAYASLGLVAVVIDARGTTYRSREFLHATYGKLNVNGLDDHVAAIRELGRRFPYLDTTNIGVIGRSFGGWGALRAMLEFPDFFRVGVAGAPPSSQHNMYLDYHETAMHGRPVYSDGSEIRPAANEVPRNYTALDGRQQADRLKGRLLIIMGELDENVVPGTTMQFMDALMRANKDFDLIYLPNQNHYFTGNPYVTRRVWDYLVTNLIGATPPLAYRVQAP